jgi:transcriptional regulator NrdR family protein
MSNPDAHRASGAFRCPQCDEALSVMNSRGVRGNYRRRQYYCPRCNYRTTSVEVLLPEEVHFRDADSVTLLNELRLRLDSKEVPDVGA